MKRCRCFNTIRFCRFTFDFILLTIAVLLLAQTNSAQPSILQRSQHPTPQEIKLENTSKSGWVAVGVAGGVGCIGFVIVRHNRRMALRRNRNLQEMAPEEDTYFG